MVEYYQQRSNAGLIVTEGTAISEEGSGWPNSPRIYLPEHVDGWKKVVQAVHAEGSIIYCELWHIGRQTHSSFHPTTNRIVSPSSIPMGPGNDKPDIYGMDRPNEIPHELTIDEIQTIVKDYICGAKCAKEAGFDGIELHGANGYLLDCFFQSSTNHRTDQYGGSIENRCRIVHEILDAIIAAEIYPSHRIGLKLSPNGAFGDMGSKDNYDTFTYLARSLKSYDLAFLEVMDGLGFHNKGRIVTVYDIKKEFAGPIIANTGLTKDTAEGVIRSGAADMASFGRPYLSNPDLVQRFMNDWPLAPDAEFSVWYSPSGAKGYTDFPRYTHNSSN
jgi:N-ethylmaleimide reductase